MCVCVCVCVCVCHSLDILLLPCFFTQRVIEKKRKKHDKKRKVKSKDENAQIYLLHFTALSIAYLGDLGGRVIPTAITTPPKHWILKMILQPYCKSRSRMFRTIPTYTIGK